ncbi:MAG: DUF4249 domain-containing protein [Bacteroidota bacterium]
MKHPIYKLAQRSLFIAMLFGLLISACTTNLEVPLPEHPARFTLNTFLTEGQPIDLYVSRSFGLLESVENNVKDILIPDAEVKLYKNGQFLDEMVFVDSSSLDTIYLSSVFGFPDSFEVVTRDLVSSKFVPSKELPLPVAGDIYRFEVSHPDYEPASAETRIPFPATLLSVQRVIDSVEDRDFDDGYLNRFDAIKIRLEDPSGPNGYNVWGELMYTNPEYGPDTMMQAEWSNTEVVRELDGLVYGNALPIPDTEFDGGIGELITFYRYQGCCGYPEDIQQGRKNIFHQYKLKVFVLTEAYATYQTKFIQQRQSRLDGIESVFVPSEPVVIPSNVEGGFGIVGAYNHSTIILDL